MKNKLYLILFAILPLGIYASSEKMDLRYEGFLRPFPVGGFLRMDVGYGQKIWGTYKNKSPLYGMIRPHIQLQTSGVMNSTKAFFEFHPISFLSFYVGREYTYRSATKLSTFDCKTVYCNTGMFKRNHWGSRIAMKIKKVFYLGLIQWQTTILKNNPYSYFAEEQGTLLGRGTRDTLFYQTHILGYQINKIHSIALLYKRNRIMSTHQSTVMTMLLYRHQYVDPYHAEKGRNFALSIGPGIYRTRQNTIHPSFIASIQYNGNKGLTLF